MSMREYVYICTQNLFKHKKLKHVVDVSSVEENARVFVLLSANLIFSYYYYYL